MIKCNVTICGKVSSEPAERTSKAGKAIITFSMDVDLPDKSSGNKQAIRVSVAMDPASTDDLPAYTIGTRLEITGTLLFRKRADNIYYNLSAQNIGNAPANEPLGIKGKMEFRGKVGKSIETKTDKKGRDYLLFSAFSSEKVDDGFESIWVKFIKFNARQEEWFTPECRIEAKGDVELSIYNDKVGITCFIDELQPYVKQSNE